MNSNTLMIHPKYPELVWKDEKTVCNSTVAKFPNSDPKNLIYLKTDDEMFHAVYDKESVYLDVYERRTNTLRDLLWMFDTITHLFTLRRNDYYNDEFYPIFYKVNDEWRLIFNRRFEGMSVYELPSGKELFHDINPSEFLGNLVELEVPDQIYKRRFYFAFSWIWGRNETPSIIDMEMIASKGECGRVFATGKYSEYMMYNRRDDFNEKDLNKLFISSIEDKGDSFEIKFDLKEGEYLSNYDSE